MHAEIFVDDDDVLPVEHRDLLSLCTGPGLVELAVRQAQEPGTGRSCPRRPFLVALVRAVIDVVTNSSSR